MKNKPSIIFASILGLFIVTSLIFATYLIPPISTMPTTSNGVSYEAVSCKYTTGDFEGRVTQPHAGIEEVVECEHNLLFDLGKNITRAALA